MMIPEEFNKLSPLRQAAIVWQDGILVGELYDKVYAYALYQLFDFYVEIKFCKTNFVLKHMCAFSINCPQLDLYIRDIDISQIAYTC